HTLFIDSGHSLVVVPEIKDWSFLSTYYYEKGEVADRRNNNGAEYKALGIRIAQALSEKEPDNFHFLVKYAQLLRKNGNNKRSVEIFRSSAANIARKFDRAVYSEWATAEGVEKNYYLNVWLGGIALADKIEKKPLRNQYDRVKISLNGMSTALYRLCIKTQSTTFFNASLADTQLGLDVKRTKRTDRVRTHEQLLKLNKHLKQAKDTKFDNQTALQILARGIVKAWEKREVDLVKAVPAANTLSFNELATFFGTEY
ncbi:MAG: hypothetical protein AAFR81_29325, partial [Chloroflexota bacterium]